MLLVFLDFLLIRFLLADNPRGKAIFGLTEGVLVDEAPKRGLLDEVERGL
jgi:hypothetical protein